MQKKCFRPWRWQFHIPSRRWNGKTLWRRSGSENIHLNPGSSRTRRRTKKIFKENQAHFLLHPHIKMAQHWMMRKLNMISGALQEISFIAITWNPESNCTCRFVDVTRNTHTSIDVMLEKHLDAYWNVDGDRELSDTWTGVTRFTILKEKPPDGVFVVRGETNEKANDLEAGWIKARIVKTKTR